MKDIYGVYVVRRGTKITVKVSDLPNKSTALVLRKCDFCGKEDWREYRFYKDMCGTCAKKSENNGMYGVKRFGKDNPAWKNGLPKCSDCGKQLYNYLNIRCRSCWAKYECGENHPGWNPNISDEERFLSKSRSMQCWGIGKWKKQVKKKDNYACKCCGSKSCLTVHHRNSYRDFKKQRIDIDNGVTLCVKCHKLFHHIYGTRHNRKYQIKEFLRLHKL